MGFLIFFAYFFHNRRQKLQKEFDKIKEETELQIAAMEGKVLPKSANKGDDVICLINSFF